MALQTTWTRQLSHAWMAGDNYRIEPMIAMAGYNEHQPRPMYAADFDEAEEAAIAFTESEPWRRHCRITWCDQADGAVHSAWYFRRNGEIEIERT